MPAALGGAGGGGYQTHGADRGFEKQEKNSPQVLGTKDKDHCVMALPAELDANSFIYGSE